jgi:lipopolysaccharide transport system ATP-binding protein
MSQTVDEKMGSADSLTGPSTHPPIPPSTRLPSSEVAIKVEHVSKKYCKSLKRSMLYGVEDIGRNMVGLSSRSDKLRKNEFWAVNDVSFEIRRGETLGIIGPNGAGKTTLLKMLSGIFWPDKGKITVRGRVGALIEVGAGFHPLLTGRENIYINAAILGMSKQEVDEKFDEIVEFSEIGDFIDTPVKFYSSGMFVRLGFAIAVHCEPDILLVDEVLAVGDVGFQAKCFNKIGELKNKGTAIIYVTHNMHQLSTFTKRAILFHRGIMSIDDDVNKAISEYKRLCTFELEFYKEEIEKAVMGNEHSIVKDVSFLPSMELNPGDDLDIIINYEANLSFKNIIIDTVLVRDDVHNSENFYFQATNNSFGQKIDIMDGNGSLRISFRSIPANNTIVKLYITIWEEGRTSVLFWWRNIPIKFRQFNLSTGQNHLNVCYNIEVGAN